MQMKMQKRYWLVLLLLSFSTMIGAQTGTGSGLKREGNRFSFSRPQGTTLVEFCTPSMFRVRSSATGKFEANEPWMVIKYDWQPVTVTVAEKKDHFQLTSSALKVKISRVTLRIEVYDSNNQLLSADAGGNYQKGDTVGCEKLLGADEHFFGFGERMDFMDQRSKKLQLNVGRGKGMPHIIGAYDVLQANYSPIPFFMSTRGYGIFFHNAFATEWDMGAAYDDRYSFRAAGGELDYYFIAGPRFPEILERYTQLTGRSPLLPKFALGLHVGTYSGGTWGYEQFSSDRYVIELARRLRAMGIPADILWLDSTWRIFGKKGGKGATSFEWRETFQNPKAMFDSLYALHFKMAGLHLRPRFDNGNAIRLLDTAQQLGFTYPEKDNPGEFVNFFDSAAVDFWWKHGVMRLASLGARFLKTDEGSAFGALANESNKTGPSGREIGRLHNLFPIAYAKAPYEKFSQYNKLRGLNHTREGYAGIQRYPFIFAGDWPSEWQYFEPVIKAGLNIGLSGVGYWTHCMGGFEHNADPELYMRWCQFGMLSPLAIVFGMDHPGYKEPWSYGEEALRNFKKYDSLRYCLIPYLYSAAYQQYKTGLPMMRALVLHYQDDENVYPISDQYMLGDQLLVCPVTTKGAQTRTLYLPEGEWFDCWSGKKFSGRRYVNVVASVDRIPLFVKAGAIIPQQPVMNYMDEKEVTTLLLQVYPGNGTMNYYEDEGNNLDYQKEDFGLTVFNVKSDPGYLHISATKKAGNYQSDIRQVVMTINQAAAPRVVKWNGQPVPLITEGEIQSKMGYYYNEQAKQLYVNLPSGKDLLLDISY